MCVCTHSVNPEHQVLHKEVVCVPGTNDFIHTSICEAAQGTISGKPVPELSSLDLQSEHPG